MIEKFTVKQVADSRDKALKRVLEYLSTGDIEGQFKNRDADFWGKEKFIVSWLGSWNKLPCEFTLDMCDGLYKEYSGYVCIYATRSLVHEKQLGGFYSFEQGLLTIGLKLCRDKKQKLEFFNKYVKPYNERVNNAGRKKKQHLGTYGQE